MNTVAGAMRTMDNLVDFNNADILSALKVNASSNSNNNFVQFMEGPSNLTINSNGCIGQHNDNVVDESVTKSESEEDVPPITKKSRANKRDRTGKFQEKVKYRQTTLLQKWKTASGNPSTLQHNAETLSKHTGVMFTLGCSTLKLTKRRSSKLKT